MLGRLSVLVGAAALLAACSTTPSSGPVGPGAPSGPGVGTSQYAPGSQQDLAATAGDRVFFAYDRADISSDGQKILERQAQWLQRYPNVSVTIEGHCDELALGDPRAEATKHVLVALGIPASRIHTISYGKERPIVVGDNEEAYAQNRVAITTVQ
jgi:peptidoglycan-associated lipoprotein